MEKEQRSATGRPCLSRREFLLGGMATTTIFLLACQRSETGDAGDALAALEAELARYPRKKVGTVSQLQTDVPARFNYPYEDLNSLSFMVKLGVPAGGGVGPQSDIVAFNTLCTHMGGDLSDVKTSYLKDHKVVGPCPLHLTTYDLTRYGMVVSGFATESLPQVVLEVEGDDIYATGILGLVYGKRNSLDAPVA
jgi:arsenite oxidase small subunit